jgi:hypothetical protein
MQQTHLSADEICDFFKGGSVLILDVPRAGLLQGLNELCVKVLVCVPAYLQASGVLQKGEWSMGVASALSSPLPGTASKFACWFQVEQHIDFPARVLDTLDAFDQASLLKRLEDFGDYWLLQVRLVLQIFRPYT